MTFCVGSHHIASTGCMATDASPKGCLTSLRREISKNFILRFAKPDPAKQLKKVTWPPKKSMMLPECLSAQPRLEAALAQLFLKHLTCGISTSSSHQHVDRHLAAPASSHLRMTRRPIMPELPSCTNSVAAHWLRLQKLPSFGSFTGSNAKSISAAPSRMRLNAASDEDTIEL